jgi:putative acetyltransferase
MIRDETPADVEAIRAVVDAAFPGPQEARLVDLLRADGALTYSLVAIEDSRVVGHVGFSPMAAPFRALGLGPLAVLPEHQRRGIGSRLVKAGLARATADGWQAVFLLGNPRYYERFGFSVALAAGFTFSYPRPHFMVRPLGADSLPALTGSVEYAPAFGRLDD